MKMLISILIIVTTVTYANCQGLNCTSFETLDQFVKIDSNSIWKIGHPNKPVFNSCMYGSKSIMTDTLNPYPVNDTSSFKITMHLYNNIAEENIFEISLSHRFDTDSLLDNCFIDFSVDGGNNWFNLFSDTLDLYPNSSSHYFFSSGTIIYGDFPFTGNSHGWVGSVFKKNLWQGGVGNLTDSIIIKFSFISDSINSNKDGWQIDYFCTREDHFGAIIEASTLNNFATVYPNPANQEFAIKYDNSFHQLINLDIYNSYNQNVYQRLDNADGIIELEEVGLKPGIYFYKLSTNDIVKGFGKIVIF